MTICSPPWDLLTEEDISRRVTALTTTISSASEVRRCFSRGILFSTGNEAIDWLLPDGGVTCGTVLEIFGPPAAGKSHLVQRMIADFAVRGTVEWATMTETTVGHCSFQHGCEEEKNGDEEVTCKPQDWCVFFLLSDPSSVSPRHLYGLLKERLMSVAANSVQCGEDAESLLLTMQQKIKLVSFTTPNDLLVFFRFLSHVEYNLSRHHTDRRRVLVVVDNLARLWEHPSCGATSHTRHWMTAALVQEVRNSVVVGNGWRNESRDVKVKSRQEMCGATPSNLQRTVNDPRGSVAVVFVNGSTNMYYRRSGTLPSGPLGGPVWFAAGADLRLHVEPLFNVNGFSTHGKSNSNGHDTQRDALSAKKTTRVCLVKGGGALGGKTVVV